MFLFEVDHFRNDFFLIHLLELHKYVSLKSVYLDSWGKKVIFKSQEKGCIKQLIS